MELIKIAKNMKKLDIHCINALLIIIVTTQRIFTNNFFTNSFVV